MSRSSAEVVFPKASCPRAMSGFPGPGRRGRIAQRPGSSGRGASRRLPEGRGAACLVILPREPGGIHPPRQRHGGPVAAGRRADGRGRDPRAFAARSGPCSRRSPGTRRPGRKRPRRSGRPDNRVEFEFEFDRIAGGACERSTRPVGPIELSGSCQRCHCSCRNSAGPASPIRTRSWPRRGGRSRRTSGASRCWWSSRRGAHDRRADRAGQGDHRPAARHARWTCSSPPASRSAWR